MLSHLSELVRAAASRCIGYYSVLSTSGVRHSWSRLLDGKCGIVSVKDRSSRFAALPCQVAAVVPEGSIADGGWTAGDWLSRDVSLLRVVRFSM